MARRRERQSRQARRPIFRLRRRDPGVPRTPRIPRLAYPSTFTLLNLLSGFYAIINAAEGNFVAAAWLIVAAALFDVFDGMMARIVNGTSEFGVELDSLADVVSFGVAPSYLLYAFGLEALGLAGVVVAALPAICGAVRLARFNVTFQVKKDYFTGLPIPAQAGTVVAFILVFAETDYFAVLEREQLTILATLVVVLSALMISTIRFDAIPGLSPRFLRQQPLKALALLIAILLLIFLQSIGLFIVAIAYLGHGIGRALLWAFRTATEEDGESPEPREESGASFPS